MQLITIFAILVAAGGVTFALQNDTSVAVTFLAWQFNSSLATVLLLSLAVGGFIVALVSTPSTLRRQWALTRQGQRIKELELTNEKQKQEIAALQSRLLVAAPAMSEERQYVGLKHIVANMP